MRQEERTRNDRRRWFTIAGAVGRVATGILLLAYGWWATSLTPFSAAATVAVVVPGAAALVVGSLRRRPKPADRVRGIGAWIALAVTAIGWELAAYLQYPRADHPTLSSLTNAALSSHSIRTAAFALWLVAAVELGRR